MSEQQSTVTAADARTFVADFVPDPDGLKSMPDDKVVEYHTRVTQALTKHGPKVVPFGEGWRKAMAGEDEKELKQVERYASPADVWKKARALETRLSSGELRSTLPKDATPEQITAWRAENGIPVAPDKYALKLRDGLVVGEEDKPIVDGFLKAIHSQNLNDAQVSAAVDWYYDEQERQTEARSNMDRDLAKKAEDELRLEWQGDYRRNESMIQNLLAGAPEGLKDQLMGGRLADGTPIMASPAAKRFFAQLAREINPAGTVVPSGGANVEGSIDDEIAKLTKLAGDRSSDYWKGALDTNGETKHQKRLRELNEAKAGLEERKQRAA